MKLMLIVLLIVIAFSIILWFTLNKIYTYLKFKEEVEKVKRVAKEELMQDKLDTVLLKQAAKNKRERIKVLEGSLAHRAELKDAQDELKVLEQIIKDIDKENESE